MFEHGLGEVVDEAEGGEIHEDEEKTDSPNAAFSYEIDGGDEVPIERAVVKADKVGLGAQDLEGVATPDFEGGYGIAGLVVKKSEGTKKKEP